MKVRYIFDRVCFAKSTLQVYENIDLFKSAGAIYNGKTVETGAKELSLTYMNMNSNLIYDYVRIGLTNTHTFV